MKKKELLVISVLVMVLLLIGAVFVLSRPPQLPPAENLVDECQGLDEKECRENSACRAQTGKKGEFITCCPIKSEFEEREECLRVY